VSEAVNSMLHSPYEGTAQDFFFENKVREILFSILHKGVKKFYPGITDHDLSAIYAADQLILSNLDKHFTTSEIAKKVHLNEFKLKTGFKKVIGMALYERLHVARMERARTLLLQTDKPLKQIYEEIGFDHLTSFITSFRKHFGIPPAALRRTSS
jgi:AraC-like DNA-binding protein